jgi:xanthine dehydrogenase YagS FAD-binding subunit
VSPFGYAAAPTIEDAVAHVARAGGAEFIAGGTDMLQLLQDRVRAPSELIDINALPLAGIEVMPGGIRIGALTRMAELADHPAVRERFPIVAEALLSGASPQVRNMATIGGNLLQRTRCLYFRDVATPCNKREPESGCSAYEAHSRMNAVLGGSRHCVATYPGDLAVALVALDAVVGIQGADGERIVTVERLRRIPADTPHIESVLAPGELITDVVIPDSAAARRSRYLKVRDRTSFDFALASAAVALDIADGIIREVRVAVGGVATIPWRLRDVERSLAGQPPEPHAFRAAVERAGADAEPRPGSEFKVELMRRTVERALLAVAGAT